MEQVDKLKLLFATVFSILTALWGWFGWLVVLWWGLMLLDYYTGSRGARRRGEWTSEKAREGIAHKTGELKVFVVGLVVDFMTQIVTENIPGLDFRFTVFFSALVVVWYILTEAGSILENVEKDGAPLPPWIMKLVRWLKGKVDEVGEQSHPPDENTDSNADKH